MASLTLRRRRRARLKKQEEQRSYWSTHDKRQSGLSRQRDTMRLRLRESCSYFRLAPLSDKFAVTLPLAPETGARTPPKKVEYVLLAQITPE